MADEVGRIMSPQEEAMERVADAEDPAQIAYNIQRVEAVDGSRMELHVKWYIPISDEIGEGMRTVQSTIIVYPDEEGNITEEQARIALDEHVQNVVKPRYINPPVVYEGELSVLSEEWGTFT